jgi:hypothetical protein
VLRLYKAAAAVQGAPRDAHRSYLLELPDIVPLLVAIIRGQPSDNSVRKNALGALQKFSLRFMPQVCGM